MLFLKCPESSLLSGVLLHAAVAFAQVAPRYQREAMAAYRAGQFAQCAAIFVSALRTEPRQALTPPIGAARCHAGAGDVSEARRYLQTALDRGYRNCKLLEQDRVFEPDYYHAAIIMQHGETVEDLALARKLAQRAAGLDPTNGNALWPYAATTDRFLQRSGKPQIYGTQMRQVLGKRTREPFDPSAVTDAERERWRVPSLAEQAQELEELNAP